MRVFRSDSLVLRQAHECADVCKALPPIMVVTELDSMSKVTVTLGVTRTNANVSQNWFQQLRLRRGFDPFARMWCWPLRLRS